MNEGYKECNVSFPPRNGMDSDALPLRLLSYFLRCTYGWRLTKVPESDQGAVRVG